MSCAERRLPLLGQIGDVDSNKKSARELMCSHAAYLYDYRKEVGNQLTQLRQGTPGDGGGEARFGETRQSVPRAAGRQACAEEYRPSGS